MPASPDIAGAAALSIVEALLLSLNDRDILPEREVLGILVDAAAAHGNAHLEADHDVFHADVERMINAILASGNSVRRPKPVP